MRRPITYAEGTTIVKDILGNEVKILPNGVACTDNGDFNSKVAKYMFMEAMSDFLRERYELEPLGNPYINEIIESFAFDYAEDETHLVMDEWLDEVLANNTPLENIEKYLDEKP